MAIAHADIDTLTGAGVLGITQVQPPGLDDPPTELIATGKHVTRYAWTCVQRDVATPKVNHGWWTITRDARTDAVVKLIRLTMVPNHTFAGWMNDGDPARAADQTNDRFMTLGVPACWEGFHLVTGWAMDVTVEDVAFSY